MEEQSQVDAEAILQCQAEAFWHCAQAALAVRRRHQFFVWAQASLQRLLPHQVMVCWSWSPARRQMQPVLFNSLPLPEALQQGLQEPATLSALHQVWQQRGEQPQTWSLAHPAMGLEGLMPIADALGPAMPALQQSQLQATGLASLAVHGVVRPQSPGALEAFFVLASRAPLAPALLDLLMPSLHACWRRVQAQELRAAQEPSGARERSGALWPAVVTAREREVLEGIRQGRSNQEIGLLLGISALTVKNHVQKILRKLSASNRAQAVAQAMSLQLLSEGGGR